MKSTPLSDNLAWLWNRFRLMTTAEIGYRMQNLLRAQLERLGFFTAKEVHPANLSRLGKSWLNETPGIEADSYCQAADAILAGRLHIFSIENAKIGSVPQWNRDPLTGKKAPLSFGKTLNYRDPKLVGDMKYLWEPNRHLQLVTLAQAYHLSGDRHYLKGLLTQLNSWLDQCPYLMGPNWTSSLELAIRLINWSFVWHLIGGVNSPVFADDGGRIFLNRWLTSIYQHAHFIRGYFSRFSSANNHLIGEAAGLFVVATTWPFWQISHEWQEKAKAILIHEALLQNGSDGVNREHAISYQQFVFDFLLISALVGRANGIKFPKGYWDRIEVMLEYVASVMDISGNVPMIGDGDDGYVVRLSQEVGFCPYKSLLATGAILFSRADFKAKAGALDHKTRWLLGKQTERQFSAIEVRSPALPVRRAFNEGGYYILGCHFETQNEIRLIVDAGPLGYQSIAAHGHADALALTLSVAGREILIDPGTYAYHTKKEWRDYFRGTSAHNTVRVDGENQSVIGGNFMWLRKANAVCEIWESGSEVDRVAGRHDGYTRLQDPVVHRREILLFKSEGRIVVTDSLECRGSHLIERFWHYAEHCSVSVDRSVVFANNNGISLRMNVTEEGSEIAVLRGEELPLGGWVSRCLDVKVPSSTVVFCVRIQGNTQLVTEMVIEGLTLDCVGSTEIEYLHEHDHP